MALNPVALRNEIVAAMRAEPMMNIPAGMSYPALDAYVLILTTKILNHILNNLEFTASVTGNSLHYWDGTKTITLTDGKPVSVTIE